MLNKNKNEATFQGLISAHFPFHYPPNHPPKSPRTFKKLSESDTQKKKVNHFLPLVKQVIFIFFFSSIEKFSNIHLLVIFKKHFAFSFVQHILFSLITREGPLERHEYSLSLMNLISLSLSLSFHLLAV